MSDINKVNEQQVNKYCDTTYLKKYIEIERDSNRLKTIPLR